MCTAMFILLWKSQVADTMQVCSLCQTRISKRWITMPRISDITQTGSRAKEKEDHLSLTVFQLQDETSVSGVRQKTPFSPNCLVNPEVVRAGAELCKRRRDEANCTTSLWWGQSGFTDVSERSGYPDGVEWRGFIEAEQEMIRNILGGGKPSEMLRWSKIPQNCAPKQLSQGSLSSACAVKWLKQRALPGLAGNPRSM